MILALRSYFSSRQAAPFVATVDAAFQPQLDKQTQTLAPFEQSSGILSEFLQHTPGSSAEPRLYFLRLRASDGDATDSDATGADEDWLESASSYAAGEDAWLAGLGATSTAALPTCSATLDCQALKRRLASVQ